MLLPMRKVCHILVFICLMALTGSCNQELPVPELREGVGSCVLHFTVPAASGLEVSTKSTLDISEESKIYNVCLFIFNSSGDRVYAGNFDSSNLGSKWKVTQKTSEAGDPSNGTLIIDQLPKRDNCTLVAISNTYSPLDWEHIKDITTLADLLALPINLGDGMTIERTGMFPMSCSLSGITTGDGYIYHTGDSEKTELSLSLQRLDSRIKFVVSVADGSSIQSFTPDTWQVFRLPKKSYLLEHGAYSSTTRSSDIEDAGTAAEDFFDMSSARLFEKTATYEGENSFSFYMLENRRPPKANPTGGWTYADRERQVKTPTGTGDFVTNGDFVYADTWSTYVVITGRIVMEPTFVTAWNEISADVRYLIHLGDFSDGKYNDFDIFRNHSYLYSIYIKGIDDIRAEVSPSGTENEPGASGSVVVTEDTAIQFDCHSGARVFSFKYGSFDPGYLTWYVETPFHPGAVGPSGNVDGSGWPLDEGGHRIDYRWVEFRVNEKEAGVYKDNKVAYKPHGTPGTMYVDEFMDYLREQHNLRQTSQTNDFDADDKIKVTVFVKENYYTSDPVTGLSSATLWKSFVNQPHREMHILASSLISNDRETVEIRSALSLQQKSIQTIYNVEAADLASAWGSEYYDELGEATYTPKPTTVVNRGNKDLQNGRSNSLKIWEWTPTSNGGHTHMRLPSGLFAKWSDYLNLEGKDGEDELLPEYKYVRYNCMSRNRDDDGDGYVDLDEVQWYMAATNQMLGLFLGAFGLEGDGRLYQRTLAERSGSNWRQHLLASTAYDNDSDNHPRLVWAEEGFTGSHPGNDNKATKWSTRCLRNLGYTRDSGGNVTDTDFTDADVDKVPDNYLVATRCKDVNGVQQRGYTGTDYANIYYEFDFSRLNVASLRKMRYTSDLGKHDETSEESCVYTKFQTAPKGLQPDIPVSLEGLSVQRWPGMNEYLDNHPGTNPFCPEGYRLPNIRELTVYWNYVSATSPMNDRSNLFKGRYAHSRTHYSFGPLGTYNKNTGEYGWAASDQKVLMTQANNHGTTYVRCVKDID